MLKAFLVASIVIAGVGVANADTHPLFSGKTVSSWTEKVPGKQWGRYIKVEGELVRVDYIIVDGVAGYTVRRDCGDGEEISLGTIRADAAVGFIADCGNTRTNYTYDLKAVVEKAGMPDVK